MLNHGGQLRSFSKDYDRPFESWVDLSTGINAEPWPVPAIPQHIFTELPELNEALMATAQSYYQTDNLLHVAGSQAAIRALPYCRAYSKVAVPSIGYAEHRESWRIAGHDIIEYSDDQIESVIDQVDVLVIINPNNPTAKLYDVEQLLVWHRRLQSRGAWLIVDEAFIDATSELSCLQKTIPEGLIVLRSVGKFFGLAGIRSGFVCAEQQLLSAIENRIGPWAASGISQFITKKALADVVWVTETKQKLKVRAVDWQTYLQKMTNAPVSSSTLFSTVMHPQSVKLFYLLAEQGIYCRLLDNQQGLRFALPSQQMVATVKSRFALAYSKI